MWQIRRLTEESMTQWHDEEAETYNWAATWQNQQSECAPSEDLDQPGHPPSLIRVFVVRLMDSYGSKLSSCGQRRLWSDWADAQAYLSLRWAHTHLVGFVMSRLIYGMATSQDLFGIAKTILRGQWKEKEGEADRRRNGKATFKNWQKWVRRFPEGSGRQVKVETILLQRHLRCFDYQSRWRY